MKNTDINKILYFTGSVITILGAFAEIFDVPNAAYLFSVGAVLLIYVQLKFLFDNRNAELRGKRLARNQVFSTLLLAVAAYLMYTGSNSWVVAVLIYALTTFMLSFRTSGK